MGRVFKIRTEKIFASFRFFFTQFAILQYFISQNHAKFQNFFIVKHAILQNFFFKNDAFLQSFIYDTAFLGKTCQTCNCQSKRKIL